MFRRSIFSSPPSPPRQRVTDGVPCRPYRAGEHAATVSRMLLSRLVWAAVISALLSVVVPFVITLLALGQGPASVEDVPVVARWIASPLGFGVVMLVVDWLLLRGRLARSISLLTWAGRRDLAGMRAATGLARATDREAARRWLSEHRDPEHEPLEVLGWRVHLQILVGDFGPAEATLRLLRERAGVTSDDPEPAEPPERPVWRARLAAIHAQLNLAQGLPFDAADLRTQIAALSDPEARADLAAEAAALIAQARWTCGGDHIGAVAWAAAFVGDRDRGTLLRGYWLPIAALTLITTLVIGFLFPVSG